MAGFIIGMVIGVIAGYILGIIDSSSRQGWQRENLSVTLEFLLKVLISIYCLGLLLVMYCC